VIQGYYASGPFGDCTSGCVTHGDPDQHFAWDFDLPEGTEVLAARSGTVAVAIGSWGSDHCGGLSASDAGDGTASQFMGNETNLVEIAHGDGTSALYLHLSHVSPGVERKAKTGEPVQQGEVLGTSGKTGYTRCVPHLHFQVEASVSGDWFTTSIPISFGDQDVVTRAADGAPVEGESYVSDNVPIHGAP
jgi:murein DD-endopeptidase MepM/ murein hydrolase activator NlpD